MKGKRTPQQLIEKGFALYQDIKPPKGIPKKNRILNSEFGTDGKLYGRIERMDKKTQKLFDVNEKMTKQGKQVWFRYEPLKLFMTFPYDLDVEKDKYGNVTIIISKREKKC